MRAAFRVDASIEIGSGHVMRCLVLAEALRRRNVESTFLCGNVPGHPAEIIRRHGFIAHLLPPNVSPANDAAECAALLRPEVDILVVDHYRLDWHWENAMRCRTRASLAIDDLANRPHDCDFLLDQNLAPNMEKRYAALVPPGCSRLLGPAYALLRDEFAAPPSPIRKRLRHDLVSFGGSDSDNLSATALQEIAGLDLTADVVAGYSNPHRAELERLCIASNGKWTLHVQTNRMAELMAQADLALGAGGTSHWERCRMGLPALVATTADNQVVPTQCVAERGACLVLGESCSLTPGIWRQHVEELMRDPSRIRAMSRAARDLVPDGNGANHVANVVLERLQ